MTDTVSMSVIIPSICGSRNGHYVCTRPRGHEPVTGYDPADGEEFLHVQESKGLPPVFWNFATRDLDDAQDLNEENYALGDAVARAIEKVGIRFVASRGDLWAIADGIRKQGFTWSRVAK